MYDHKAQRYEGYLDLLKFIDFEPYDRIVLLKNGFPIEFQLLPGNDNLLLFTCLDRLWVLGFDGTQWRQVHRVDRLSGIDVRLIKSLSLKTV